MNFREYSSNIPGYNYEEQFHHSGSPNTFPTSDIRMKENNPMMIRTFSDPRLNIPIIPSPSPSPGSPLPKRPEATFVMDISPSVVGWIIGRSGIRIKEIQAQTGCKMWVDQDVPNDQPRKIYFHGTKANIDAAVGRVSELVQAAPILASASVTSGKGLTSTIVDCPVSLVGLLIGKRGWTIKKIQQASGAQISINQSVREGLPRKIIVSGDETSVGTALHLIDEVLRDKSGLSQELDTPFDTSAANAVYLGALENYGRIDPLAFDPRLQPQSQANMVYRQAFQNMAGTPPLIPNSPITQQSFGRYPSPALRNVDDQRPRMNGVGSYDVTPQHLLQLDQNNGYDLADLNGDQAYPRRFSDDQNSVEDLLRRNSEKSEVDRWNSQFPSMSGSPLAESMLELNINGLSNHESVPIPPRQSREDGSLLSYHLRQQHQKSLLQAQQFHPQQGNVFPLTQSKMSLRPNMNHLMPGPAQPIFIPENSQPRLPSSPIDPSQRSLSDSSAPYRTSQSNSYSSPISESPLNSSLFINGMSNDQIRAPPPGSYPGIALESRSRLSSSSSSENYLDQYGQVSRSYPTNHSNDIFAINGINKNQIDDSNPLNQLNISTLDNYGLQQKDQVSRSLPSSNFEMAGSLPQTKPHSTSLDFHPQSYQSQSLYSPLYPERSPTNYSDSGLYPPSTSPQRKDPIYDEMYGLSENYLGFSAEDSPNFENGLTGLLGNNGELETLSTSLGSNPKLE